MQNIVLLSIRPQHAKKIFDGTKKVELRRVCPRVDRGDLVVVYETSPKKAVIGSFTVEKVIVEQITFLWERVEHKAGITADEFFSYYEGASVGVGIFFRETQRFSYPVSLEVLREKWGSWRPPQSFRYMSDTEYKMVKSLSRCQMV